MERINCNWTQTRKKPPHEEEEREEWKWGENTKKIHWSQQGSWQIPYVLLCDAYLCECCGRFMSRKPRIGQLLRWSAMACKIGIRSSADVNYLSVFHLLYTEFAAHAAPRPAGTVKRSVCEVELPAYKSS